MLNQICISSNRTTEINSRNKSLKVSLNNSDVTGSDNRIKYYGSHSRRCSRQSRVEKGDKIVNIDGTKITTYDYMEKLQHIAPNQISNITIERDKAKVILIKF